MAYGKRTDSTHAAIRDGLRTLGVTVWDTSGSAHTRGGRGNPDLVAYWPRTGFMAFWVKRPRGTLTPAEQDAVKRGDPLVFVESLEAATKAMGIS